MPKRGYEGPPESLDAETRFREMPVVELLEALEWVWTIQGDHTPGLDRKLGQLINDIASVGFETLRDREGELRAAGLTHRADRWLHYENYL